MTRCLAQLGVAIMVLQWGMNPVNPLNQLNPANPWTQMNPMSPWFCNFARNQEHPKCKRHEIPRQKEPEPNGEPGKTEAGGRLGSR